MTTHHRAVYLTDDEWIRLLNVLAARLSGARIDDVRLTAFEIRREISTDRDTDACTIRVVREFRLTKWSKGIADLIDDETNP
ncbi:MAG: hypothetical protein AMJ46_12570 [Latescibacteria bacterium DG_63]|nr:MAG: hypothetical protein AMJ46_12570 [Latescibacteria bacterium DG_63]